MKTKKMLLWLCILLVVISSFLGATNRPTQAQSSSGPDATVMAKLDQIIDSQKNIIDSLASMKEELRIIKIRVTQLQ